MARSIPVAFAAAAKRIDISPDAAATPPNSWDLRHIMFRGGHGRAFPAMGTVGDERRRTTEQRAQRDAERAERRRRSRAARAALGNQEYRGVGSVAALFAAPT